MVGLGALPAAAQAFFLFFLPESRKCPVCVMRGLCAEADMEGGSAYHDPQGQHRGGAWDYDENICIRNPRASRPQGAYPDVFSVHLSERI